MNRSRLDSFSDGVIAVIITIMVLELKVPGVKEMSDAEAIRGNLKMLAVYLLSFVQTGIYWVNHHYLLDDLDTVSHGVLWSNLIFLFSLSLIPFGTEWIGIRGVTAVPVAVYAVCFIIPAISWMLLANVICNRTRVRPAAGPGKQILSAVVNLAAVAVAFRSPATALGMIGFIAFLWLLPPRRIVEKTHAAETAAAANRKAS